MKKYIKIDFSIHINRNCIFKFNTYLKKNKK